MFFLILGSKACKKEKFEIGNNTESVFHISTDNYSTPVLVRGNTASKKIILYVQGGPGLNTLDFAFTDYPEWKNSLEQDYAVAYYDQRGTGNRQDNFEMDDISIQTYIEDLHTISQFLEKAYNAEVILMGHSFGGILIYRYIAHYAEHGIPDKYITLNAPATSDKDEIRWEFRRDYLLNTANAEINNGINVNEWKKVLVWLDEHPEIKKIPGDDPWRDIKQWNQFVEDLILYKYPLKSASASDYLKVLFRSPYNPIPAYLNRSIIEQVQDRLFDDFYSYKMIERLDEVNQPILMITGRHDDICPPEEMEYVIDHISSQQKKLVVLENASHDSFLHQKDQFVNEIKNYIK